MNIIPSYTAPITRNTPGLFGFVLDMSGSMSEPISFEGSQMRKCDALNVIVNRTIYELICRCRKFSGYYDYFQFFAIGYSDNQTVDLFEDTIGNGSVGSNIYSVNDLVSSMVEKKTFRRQFKDENDKIISSTYSVPQYLCPGAMGNTPMYQALRETHNITKKWLSIHGEGLSFPPMIIHITDGDVTDAPVEEVLDVAEKIKGLSSGNGNVLILNIHIGDDVINEEVITFPRNENELRCVKNATDLFKMSSVFPETMLELVKKIKKADSINDVRNSRMMTFNSSMITILEAINIGTISVANHI
ncbi:MAG: VWA domain-containing protein [Bacteroidetes bacterium]|nr:VWA domain-containing protein [Bacteroidota bacterium]